MVDNWILISHKYYYYYYISTDEGILAQESYILVQDHLAQRQATISKSLLSHIFHSCLIVLNQDQKMLPYLGSILMCVPGSATSMTRVIILNKKLHGGFPGGAVVENLPASAGDTGSSPGLGGSHMPRSN